MKVNEALNLSFNVKHRITSAYHPQANGLDERANQTLKRQIIFMSLSLISCNYHKSSFRCLAKVCTTNQDDWDDFIDPVLFSYRSAVHETTKYTPFYLMHGREARFPLQVEKSCHAATDTGTEL